MSARTSPSSPMPPRSGPSSTSPDCASTRCRRVGTAAAAAVAAPDAGVRQPRRRDGRPGTRRAAGPPASLRRRRQRPRRRDPDRAHARAVPGRDRGDARRARPPRARGVCRATADAAGRSRAVAHRSGRGCSGPRVARGSPRNADRESPLGRTAQRAAPRRPSRGRDPAGARVRVRCARDHDGVPRAPVRARRDGLRARSRMRLRRACDRSCAARQSPRSTRATSTRLPSRRRARTCAPTTSTSTVFEADAASDDLPEADLWVANLASGPLTDVLARHDAPGRAIVSGLYADDLPRMSGWHIEREVERAGWHALLVTRPSSAFRNARGVWRAWIVLRSGVCARSSRRPQPSGDPDPAHIRSVIRSALGERAPGLRRDAGRLSNRPPACPSSQPTPLLAPDTQPRRAHPEMSS